MSLRQAPGQPLRICGWSRSLGTKSAWKQGLQTPSDWIKSQQAAALKRQSPVLDWISKPYLDRNISLRMEFYQADFFVLPRAKRLFFGFVLAHCWLKWFEKQGAPDGRCRIPSNVASIICSFNPPVPAADSSLWEDDQSERWLSDRDDLEVLECRQFPSFAGFQSWRENTSDYDPNYMKRELVIMQTGFLKRAFVWNDWRLFECIPQ